MFITNDVTGLRLLCHPALRNITNPPLPALTNPSNDDTWKKDNFIPLEEFILLPGCAKFRIK
jgi:hypothetical protein